MKTLFIGHIAMVLLLQSAMAGTLDLDDHCKNWSKDPACWDATDPNSEEKSCPEEYGALVIVVDINETEGEKSCTFYTVEEYGKMQANPTFHFWPMSSFCDDLDLSIGDILQGTIAYSKWWMRTGDILCRRYLKGLY